MKKQADQVKKFRPQPPMLGRHPGQFDSKKEKRRKLRNEKTQATMAERKRLKKVMKSKLKEVECYDNIGSKKRERKQIVRGVIPREGTCEEKQAQVQEGK